MCVSLYPEMGYWCIIILDALINSHTHVSNNLGILYSPIFLHVALNRDSQSKNHKRMTRIYY